ncbi:FAD-dependent oxidoreductase [Cryobacterium sp. SO2]|uniref:NAD(P)/FAD-dependent oxidoreductase n=1 Tax=Cryobacterium sp. SO2 TaxID=1897060 RepID=UPI00223CE4A2|nr:FAD-dependent oxidoreductase [Cryobacterium sp. SO2]WEO78780.1 FAD-dependent oxidoreductase [Cryobacterium sp. SO2]
MSTCVEHRVVVIGAGYAGILAANRVQASLTAAEARRVRVTLVNPRADFIERVRLHEVAAGVRSSAAIPLGEMLHERIEIVLGTVLQIDAPGRLLSVLTSNAAAGSGITSEPYDTLVYAVGSVAALGAPGVGDFAHLLGNPDGAETARRALATGPHDQRVVVVGGGATGVEAAAEFAEQYPSASVTLVSRGTVLAHLPVASRRYVARSLARLGVTVLEGNGAVRVLSDAVELADGTRVPSEVTVWTASFAVPDLARRSGLAVDPIGRLLVDDELRAVEHPEIFGAGDAVRPPPSVAAHLRMGCAVAMPLGGHAADNVLAGLRGKPLTKLDIGFAAQCISIGRRRGIIQLLTKADQPRPIRLTGRAGAVVKEFVCAVIATGSPRRERTHPGSLLLPSGPKRMPGDLSGRDAPGRTDPHTADSRS